MASQSVPIPITADSRQPVAERLPTSLLWRQYRADLNKVLATLDELGLGRVIDRLRDARDSGASIYIAGNGGSAATATHWANDLGKATRVSGRPGLRVTSLTDNGSWLTALANDEGYERVFAGQLENFAKPDDVLMVISASGNSPNLVEAVATARRYGVFSIALLGFDGGRLLGMVDEPLWVSTEVGAYGIAETAHSVIADVIAAALMVDKVHPET